MRRWVAARPTAFWIVAGLTLVAAALRFATLGVQSYHHDEVVTASRILRADFWHAMDAVGFSESAPPLYYALAWVWTQVTGTGEYGLRSLSALAGVATVPVAYLFGAALRDRRAGIAAAALVAVNPMLLWYSQEARAYSLLVLFCAVVGALLRPRARPRGPPRVRLVGDLLRPGAGDPLLRDLPDRGRGDLAGAEAGWPAGGARSGDRRGRRDRPGTARDPPDLGRPRRVDRRPRPLPPGLGDGRDLLRRRDRRHHRPAREPARRDRALPARASRRSA